MKPYYRSWEFLKGSLGSLAHGKGPCGKDPGWSNHISPTKEGLQLLNFASEDILDSVHLHRIAMQSSFSSKIANLGCNMAICSISFLTKCFPSSSIMRERTSGCWVLRCWLFFTQNLQIQIKRNSPLTLSAAETSKGLASGLQIKMNGLDQWVWTIKFQQLRTTSTFIHISVEEVWIDLQFLRQQIGIY